VEGPPAGAPYRVPTVIVGVAKTPQEGGPVGKEHQKSSKKESLFIACPPKGCATRIIGKRSARGERCEEIPNKKIGKVQTGSAGGGDAILCPRRDRTHQGERKKIQEAVLRSLLPQRIILFLPVLSRSFLYVKKSLSRRLKRWKKGKMTLDETYLVSGTRLRNLPEYGGEAGRGGQHKDKKRGGPFWMAHYR